MNIISQQLPLTVDFADSYAKGRSEDQKFISDFAQLIGTFLKEHSNLVEVLELNPTQEQLEVKQAHALALKYLLKIGQVEDVEVFKVSLFHFIMGVLYVLTAYINISVIFRFTGPYKNVVDVFFRYF